MPLEFVRYLNITKSFCQVCKTRNTLSHLQTIHDCQVPDVPTLLQMTLRAQNSKVPRRESLEMVKQIINPFLMKIQRCINEQAIAGRFVKE